MTSIVGIDFGTTNSVVSRLTPDGAVHSQRFRLGMPLSRQAILTGLLITVLPMLGDYYTNQMLSGAASTSMIGNLIQGQLGTPGLKGQGAVLSLMLLIVLLIPMIYYVIATNREAAR